MKFTEPRSEEVISRIMPMIHTVCPSVAMIDRGGYDVQPEFGGAYTAALPAVKGGGQAIMVSSAEPGEYQTLLEAV